VDSVIVTKSKKTARDIKTKNKTYRYAKEAALLTQEKKFFELQSSIIEDEWSRPDKQLHQKGKYL
jgi:hypothetical protein